MMKGQSNVASLVSAIGMWNSPLPTRVAAFLTANSGANVTLVDTQEPWNRVNADPKSYGAPDATRINSNGSRVCGITTTTLVLLSKKVVAALKGSFY
jgi:hypothetical protein